MWLSLCRKVPCVSVVSNEGVTIGPIHSKGISTIDPVELNEFKLPSNVCDERGKHETAVPLVIVVPFKSGPIR